MTPTSSNCSSASGESGPPEPGNQAIGFRVLGLGFRVSGVGFRVIRDGSGDLI